MTPGIEVAHVRIDSDIDVYGGRGKNAAHISNTQVGERGWLGNPYKITKHQPRLEVIARYSDVFLNRVKDDVTFKRAVHGLRGKRVGCWCRSVTASEPPCHLDVVDRYLTAGTHAAWMLAHEEHYEQARGQG